MPQFQFSATDRMGNRVDGTVTASDMSAAADQVRGMGYAPQQLANVGGGTVDTMPAMSPAMPLSAPTAPTAYAPLTYAPPVAEQEAVNASPLRMLLNDEPTHEGERLEPWMRGGPIEQATPPAPTMTLNDNGVPVMRSQQTAQGAQSQGNTVYTPTTPTSRPLQTANARTVPGQRGLPAQTDLWTRFKQRLIYPLWSGVVIKELAPFYRQFATLINAGLPIYQALGALEANTRNPKLKEIAREGQRVVMEGGRFSEVMARYPWIISPLQVEMVRAAELGGMLDQTLHHIADYVEHDLEMRRLINRETFYPKLVLFLALMILGRHGFLGGMPAISSLILGSVMGVGEYSLLDYLRDTLGFGMFCAAPFVAVTAVSRLFFFNVEGIREAFDHFKMSLPGLGDLVRMFATAKFCRTFAALYRGGFSMSEALEISGNACGNAVLRKAAHRAIPSVERGELASETLQRGGMFTPMTVDMIRTGETTGNLDVMMDKVADYYESEGKMKSHMVAMAFSMAVFLIVAIIVAKSIIGQWTAIGQQRTQLPDDTP